MKHLNYNHLLYFKTVVDCGSIVEAAHLLRVGAPAISMQIKVLENQIQRKLFVRSKRSLQVTSTGRVVYEYAKDIFSTGEELLTKLSETEGGKIRIHIGIQDSVPKNLISKITSYIHSNCDAVISVSNGDLQAMTLGVAQHEFDLAILNYPPFLKDKSILYYKRILNAKIVLAGAHEFLHLKGKPLSAFKDIPFVLPSPQSGLRHKIEHFFSENGLDEITFVGEAQDTIVQKNMAIAGDGVVPIMKDAITNYIRTHQLYILKELPDLHDEIWLVTGKRKLQNPIARKLMSSFRFH